MKLTMLFAMLSVPSVAALAFQLPHAAPEPLVHMETAFDLTLHARMSVVAPLFGAENERVWAGADWNPHFLYPQPTIDQAGAVFTVQHTGFAATWVCTAFDLAAGHIQYVYVIPDAMATRIDIHLTQKDANTTLARVLYERTALNSEANGHVQHFARSDQKAGPEWEKQINVYLSKQQQSH